MNTSKRLVQTLFAEMYLLSRVDKLKVLFFVLKLYIKKLPERWMKSKILKSLSRSI
jgi:hypothetical protein